MNPDVCPWCKREPRVKQVKPEGSKSWEVMCVRSSECPVTAFVFGKTREDAIRKWNRRTK